MFEVIEAKRESAPITAAFIGGSGSGKTYSAPTQAELAPLAGIKNRCDCVEFLGKLEKKGFIIKGSGWREITITRRIG